MEDKPGEFFEKIVTEAQRLHGTDQVGVLKLDYKRPAYKDVFQGSEAETAKRLATSEPKPQGQPFPKGEENLPVALRTSHDDGVGKALAQLRLQAARCPNQHFVLAGHSLGAWVLGDALPELSEIYARIGAVFFAGDPMFDGTSPGTTRPGGQDGPLRASQGIAARALGPRVPYLPLELWNRSQSYCLDSPIDPICNTPDPDGVSGQKWADAFEACTPSEVTDRTRLSAALGCGHLDGVRFGPLVFGYKGDYAAAFLRQLSQPSN